MCDETTGKEEGHKTGVWLLRRCPAAGESKYIGRNDPFRNVDDSPIISHNTADRFRKLDKSILKRKNQFNNFESSAIS